MDQSKKKTCIFCDRIFNTKTERISHDRKMAEHKKLKEELEATKSLLQQRDDELEEEMRKNRELSGKVDPDAVMRAIKKREKLKDDIEIKNLMKRVCLLYNIRLSYEPKGKRFRYSFKSDFTSNYYRVNFAHTFNILTLFNRMEDIIDQINKFVNGANIEGLKENLYCKLIMENDNLLKIIPSKFN